MVSTWEVMVIVFRLLAFMILGLSGTGLAQLGRLHGDVNYKHLEVIAKGLYFIENLYVDETKVEPNDVALAALGGVLKALDPHSVLMPAEAFRQLTIDTQGKFGGVGLVVSGDGGTLRVVSPIDSSPAAKAGIIAGDTIVAIDGKKIADLPKGKATEAMRGPPGSKIKLEIKRKDSEKTMIFELVREIIKLKSVNHYSLGPGVRQIRISNFQDDTTDEVMKVLDDGAIDGLVLDLRDNPGGLLDQAVKVSDLFLESGVIVSTVGRSRKDIEREFAHKRGTYPPIPIIVLINGGSASASEIVAGALQDHQRALIMGTTSFGKGSVQTLVALPNGAGIKLTVARYYTPNDRSIQARGIKPDIIVTQAGQKSIKMKKESDLDGHISAADLSEIGQSTGTLAPTRNWPKHKQMDRQLVTAYTYLQGLALLKKASPASTTRQ